MKYRILIATAASVVFAMVFALSAFAQEQKSIQLPAPKLDSKKSLVQALKDRKTTREYSTKNLPEQTISNLLWAAWGINRPDTGKRTAPSAVNWQETELYVSTTQGTYLYDPKGNALIPVLPGDNRALTYTQVDRFKDAPFNLVYVADFQKMGDRKDEEKMMAASMDTGFIAQNVYLYCASQNLPTCFRASIDREKFGQAVKLRPTQKVIAAQSVGLPKGK